MAPSITDRTISACNGLQISSIPKEWADHAWNSDFLESQGFPEVLENSIFDCGCFVRELQELLVISRLWSTAEGQGSLNEGNLTFLIIWITELGAFDLRLTILCIVKRENLEGGSNNRSTFIKLLSIATHSGYPGGLTPRNPWAFAPRHLQIPPTQVQYSSQIATTVSPGSII